MSMNVSEIANFSQQRALEEEAARQGLYGIANPAKGK